MPYLDNWDEFNEKARSLYDSDPTNFRVMMKYRHNDGKLKIKVTDDKKVYQYLAEQSKEVKNIDKFLCFFMSTMSQ